MLVTPTSQMVGVQAVRNVLDGQRYKSVSKEIKAYCRGEYGRTPAPINPSGHHHLRWQPRAENLGLVGFIQR